MSIMERCNVLLGKEAVEKYEVKRRTSFLPATLFFHPSPPELLQAPQRLR